MTTGEVATLLRAIEFARIAVHHDPDNPKYPVVIALHLSAAVVSTIDPALLDRMPGSSPSQKDDASKRVRRKHRAGHLTVERGDA